MTVFHPGALRLESADAKGCPDPKCVDHPFLPHHVLAVAPSDDERSRKSVALLRVRAPIDGMSAAYLCEHFAWALPADEPQELASSSPAFRLSLPRRHSAD